MKGRPFGPWWLIQIHVLYRGGAVGHEEGLQESIQISVQNAIWIGGLDPRANVFYQLVGMQDIVADL